MSLNYKSLYKKIILILTKPAEAWTIIKNEDKQKVMLSFVYPLLALASIATFIGYIIDSEKGFSESIIGALTQISITLVTLFGGIYLSCFIIEKLAAQFLNTTIERATSLKLMGYGFTLIFLHQIINPILPEFGFIAFVIQLYTIYIIWEAIPVFFNIKEEDRLKATLFIFFTIFCTPLLLSVVFSKLLF